MLFDLILGRCELLTQWMTCEKMMPSEVSSDRDLTMGLGPGADSTDPEPGVRPRMSLAYCVCLPC